MRRSKMLLRIIFALCASLALAFLLEYSLSLTKQKSLSIKLTEQPSQTHGVVLITQPLV